MAAFKAGEHGTKTYFAYYKETEENMPDQRITTWMGDTLAEVVQMFPVHEVRGFHGSVSKRQNFRAQGIDGHMYSGTYYKSGGDYVRMRRMKG